MHWISKPGTSLPEERRIVIQGSQELRAIPGVRNFGSHIGQALLAEEIAGVDFGENWISIDPEVDYDETRGRRSRRRRRGYPGHVPQRADLPRRSGSRGAHRGERAIVVRIFGPDLEVLRDEGRRGRRRRSRRINGIVDEHVELQVDVPQIEVDVDLAKAAALRDQARRRATGGGHDAWRARRSATSSVTARPTTSRSGACPSHATASATSATARSTRPSGGHVRLGDVADGHASGRRRTTSSTKTRSRRIDIGADVEGRDLGSVARDVAGRLEPGRLPARAPRRGARRVHRSARPRRTACSGSPASLLVGIIFLLLRVVQELARRLAAPSHPADRAGRRPDRRVHLPAA